MKKRFVFVIITLTFLSFFNNIAYAEFWGSKTSNKYHNPSCSWAQTITPANLIKFDTIEKAIKAGYIPCKACRPPSATKSKNNTESYFKIAKIETVDIDSQDERYAPYLKKIKIKVENIWSYPHQAFERRKEGISTVRFSLDQSGKLGASRIIKSSGYDLLDREALSAVRSAAPYEHFPQDINLSRLHIIASFQYRLLEQ